MGRWKVLTKSPRVWPPDDEEVLVELGRRDLPDTPLLDLVVVVVVVVVLVVA